MDMRENAQESLLHCPCLHSRELRENHQGEKLTYWEPFARVTNPIRNKWVSLLSADVFLCKPILPREKSFV